MSGYPGRWDLLGESGDPWPVDAADVDAAAAGYRGLASDILDQVTQLRGLAQGGNQLVGEYAPELQDSAKDLADYLERAEGRFSTVAEQLTRWSPELSGAQTRSRAMVDEAEAAQAKISANAAPTTPVDTTDTAAVDADTARSTRLTGATGELSDVVGRFRTLKSDVEEFAGTVAKRIRDASDDSLKNHRFDGFRQWVHDHADLLKKIADVLTFIATVIVVAALIIGTGGLAIAALLTAGALLVHTLLALNGDGSWADVALDAFALATFGVGKILTTGARGALALREGGAAFSEVSSAARSAFADASGLQKAVVWMTRSNPVLRSIEGSAAALGKISEVMGAEFKGGLAARLVFGDKEAAGLAQAITSAGERLGSGALLNSAGRLMDLSVPVWRAALGTDVVFKALNDANPFVFDYPGYKPWVEWKEHHTVVSGFTAPS